MSSLGVIAFIMKFYLMSIRGWVAAEGRIGQGLGYVPRKRVYLDLIGVVMSVLVYE